MITVLLHEKLVRKVCDPQILCWIPNRKSRSDWKWPDYKMVCIIVFEEQSCLIIINNNTIIIIIYLLSLWRPTTLLEHQYLVLTFVFSLSLAADLLLISYKLCWDFFFLPDSTIFCWQTAASLIRVRLKLPCVFFFFC